VRDCDSVRRPAWGPRADVFDSSVVRKRANYTSQVQHQSSRSEPNTQYESMDQKLDSA
jgi:hypothetical protein